MLKIKYSGMETGFMISQFYLNLHDKVSDVKNILYEGI